MNDDNVVFVDFRESFLDKLNDRLSRINQAIDDLLFYLYEQQDKELL